MMLTGIDCNHDDDSDDDDDDFNDSDNDVRRYAVFNMRSEANLQPSAIRCQ